MPMALRHREAPPIPHQELVALQRELAAPYSSRLWEGPGRNILVATVNRDEPDYVNDLEGVVEAAHPSDVQQAGGCLLLGNRRMVQVPVDPLRSLMADRVAFDRQQCAEMRVQLPGGLAHTFYRAPSDPKRRLRLAVRVPNEHVLDIADEDLEELVDRLGTRLEDGTFDDVHCVYLIAHQDEVRLQPGPFVDDLLVRWRDEGRRRRIQEERDAKRRQLEEERAKERAALLADLEGRLGERVAYAPMRSSSAPSHTPPGASHASVRRAPSAAEASPRTRAGPSRERLPLDEDALRMQDIHSRIDAIRYADEDRSSGMRPPETPVSPPAAVGRSDDGGSDQGAAAPGLATALEEPEPRPSTGSAALDSLADLLENTGYEVLVRPEAGVHTIALAAERPAEYPQRVIAVEHDRLGLDHAEALLAAARSLEVDLAVAVCNAVGPEAQRRIIATKVRAVRPDEIAHLEV